MLTHTTRTELQSDIAMDQEAQLEEEELVGLHSNKTHLLWNLFIWQEVEVSSPLTPLSSSTSSTHLHTKPEMPISPSPISAQLVGPVYQLSVDGLHRSRQKGHPG